MPNYIPSKKLEKSVENIEHIQRKLNEYTDLYELKIKEMQRRFGQTIEEQREEILHLKKTLDTVRLNDRERRVRALNELKSE